jgi:hypothetical protein
MALASVVFINRPPPPTQKQTPMRKWISPVG